MADSCESQEIFSNLSSKIGQLLFERTKGDRNVISEILDNLNSLNYKYPIVTSQTKGALLINQCCTFIPTDDSALVIKCCQLFKKLIKQQNIVVEGRTYIVAIQWCLHSLKLHDTHVITEVLGSLDALLRTNAEKNDHILENVSKEIKVLIEKYKEQKLYDFIFLPLRVLEACTTVLNNFKSSSEERELLFKTLVDIFISFLQNEKDSCDEFIFSKILIICLNSLQNIIVQQPSYLQTELGFVLGIIKTYMLYGIANIDFIPPQKITPLTLSIPEVLNTTLREKKGGKLTKQRKHKSLGVNKKTKISELEILPDTSFQGYTPATTTLDCNSDNGNSQISHESRLKSSDSDFSDGESGRLGRINIAQSRVRQAALSLFHLVLNYTEKPIMFSYWLSFIPEMMLKRKHNLITIILKDPSSRCRMAALNVLLQLLTSSKMYLSQAESSESTSFTPFSVTLGLTLIELHKSLSLALNENSVPVLTQVLKCFAALVQSTPYHRLTPGLITRVVRNVKAFIYHRDVTVQVTALIVLGCVLASEPVVPETAQAMIKLQKLELNVDKEINIYKIKNTQINEDFQFAEFPSDEEEDSDENNENVQIAWLLETCLRNLGVSVDEKSINTKTVPAPVKLESLQVLSAMSRNYFESIMASHLNLITKIIEISLSQRYMDLQLHVGRTVDFIGQAISRSLVNEEVKNSISIEECMKFWNSLLNDPLMTLIQNEEHAILRAVGCDCIGSIGPQIFELLSRDKQLLCITSLFSCSRDVESSVKGAAVRALAICVLYPSLREDIGFVVDTAEVIHRSLKDENLNVRIKASWSLGNLSDALVLNNKSSHSLEELPTSLLLKLLEAAINGSSNNDKIKMNAVRALGNLLQLVNEDLKSDTPYKDIVDSAFSVLVKCCTTGSNMKVRWNACYALGKALRNHNLYRNSSFPHESPKWQVTVFNSLMDLVCNFGNFKVRINAALALMSPTRRENYGQFYCTIYESLLNALANSSYVEDFSEYKHCDQLVEQICLALGHLTSLITEIDLDSPLYNAITDNIIMLENNMHKVLGRLVPEKCSTIYAAISRLNILEREVHNSKKSNISILKSVFEPYTK